ncbi:PAS domain-containing sensor histidine kinase [Bacillus wiedmannii]|uniref:PAS domain S-box protein n=1 Tax=Bacillus TaxID=1386 RepID=UPI0007CA9807|nr:PAS domain S-box protein [Bacillus wiedmannii]OAK24504.1 PAS domain-containing sensor histidine kinase [Bacillus wiedmannii]OAK34180.1 PAS domain-containing sensor histidine kinase [Bacillus wiedmannii]OAK41188.1 PAS domain-containing sensor histidine kinase [Bacillus wiedmannii]PHB76430.1 PAS domain-containing sensor histidine kinase [Bacillus wiedmannii]HDR7641687.1 PAS domain S-box protein [Bacillus wiedmannii]
MLFTGFFINLSIFSFLASSAIFIQVFIRKMDYKFIHLFWGTYAGIIAAILMIFNFKHMGLFYDLRAVPLIISFIYFGRTAGWITLIFILFMRIFYLGGDWGPALIAALGIATIYTIFKTYLKNTHRFKSVFLYLAVYLAIIHWVFGFFFPSISLILLDIQGTLFISCGLLIGVFLMESYQNLYSLTQDLAKANETLLESKQVLRDTVHELQGGIFKFKKENGDFIHTLCDGQLFYHHGFHSEQVVGKSLLTIDSSIVPFHLLPRLLKYYQEAWDGEEVNFELPWPTDETIILFSLRPVIREGTVIEVVGSTVDITKRKNAEDELKVTKERLESFVNHNVDAITIFDLDGHMIQANKAYEKIFGWSEKESLGKKLPCVPDFLMNQTLETIKNIKNINTKDLVINRVETVRQRKDNTLIDVSLTISPILDLRGNVIALSGICRDITEKKQAERELHRLHQQLRDSEMKYRALIEQATDAVYVVEMDEDHVPTRFIEVNPVGCKRFGYSREELLSIPFPDTVPQDSPMIIRLLKKIREGQTFFTLQDEFVFPTGQTITTEFSVRIFNLNGKNVFLSISRDITERLKTEELLRKSEKLAVVGQLSTAIAHEIKNPLTAMKGFMQLLKSMENKNTEHYIDIVLAEVERIDSITNEFMTLAKPEALEIKTNDLNVLMKQIVMLLEPQAIMNCIQITTEFTSDTSFILCEGNQLKQAFINVLKNAIEATPMGGEILIQIEYAPDKKQVNIQFTDYGCGIEKERLPYLGEPFYSIKENGIGLGLMICYKIIEKHQGKILIESEVGKGTTVNINLPISTLEKENVYSSF